MNEQQPPGTPPPTPSPLPRNEVQWESNGRSVHPALDFDLERRLAFVTLPLPLREGEGGGKGRVIKPYLVIVGPNIRTCIPLELANIPLDGEPCFIEPQSRWPQGHLKAFLDGVAPAPDGAEVFDTVQGLITKYVDLADPAHSRILAAFVMMTHIFPALPSCCYLKIGGQRASGKTRLASILAQLCHAALHSSSLTPASIFRVTQGTRCTLIADEMEALTKNNGLSTLLNSGYKRGAVVVRAGTKGRLELFQSYGPKVICSIEPLNEVLASRTIEIRLMPTKDTAKARLSVTETSEDWGRVRSMLYAWALTRGVEVATTPVAEVPGLSNRQHEIYSGLLAICASLEPQKQGVMKEIADYATRAAAPAVPPMTLSDQDRLLVKALTHLTDDSTTPELSTLDIRNAMQTVDAGIPPPSNQAIGYSLDRLRLLRSRRHTASGRRFVIDRERLLALQSI